ncbi:hypothetical protein Scep_023904 [Stephania cephalantha]|uniref:Uncharacterized protein n=1 Tax=Stephania cephalantha TaxID=152367 RepID=A0AAP0EW22_9MAGN
MVRPHEGVKEVVAVEVVGRFLYYRFRLLVLSSTSYIQRHLRLPYCPRRLYHQPRHQGLYQIARCSHRRRHRGMTLLYRRGLHPQPPHHRQHPHLTTTEQSLRV